MKRCKSCGLHKPLSAFHRNPETADRLCGKCKECRLLERAAYYRNNKVKLKIQQHNWRTKNREADREYNRQWRAENKERVRASQYRWRDENVGKALASSAMCKLMIRRACPLWADQEKIAELYALAHHISSETGKPHHVDHVVPLRSKLVCGLHCEANLQVITAIANRQKQNRFEIAA